ncbi:MAG TPA: hypothetical protein PLB55_23620, partial [Prosthecobacter sp.]|nr:hypothetical protein [Prosthecobacter sp.]
MKDLILHALNEARVRNARLINVLRLSTISVLLVIHTVVPQYNADATGEVVETGLVIATCLALLLWRIGLHSGQSARRTALAVPLLDMPVAFGIQWLSMSGIPGDRAVANWTL